LRNQNPERPLLDGHRHRLSPTPGPAARRPSHLPGARGMPLRGRGSGRPTAAPPRRTGAGEGRRLPPAAVQPASGLPLQPTPPRSSADTAGRREPRRLEAGPHLVGGDDLRDVLLAVAPGAAEPDMRDQTLLRGFG